MATVTHHALHLGMTTQTEGTRLLLSVVVHLLTDKTLVGERLVAQETHKVILAVTQPNNTPTM